MRLLPKMIAALTFAVAIPVGLVGAVAASALGAVEEHATLEATRSLVGAELDQLERLAGERARSIEALLAPIEEDTRVLRAAWESTTRPGVRAPGGEVYPSPGIAGLPGYGRVEPAWGAYADFDGRGPGSPWLPRFAVEAAARDPGARRRLGGELDRLMQITPLLRDVALRREGTVDLAWIVLADGATNAWPPYDYGGLLAADSALADVVEAEEAYVRLVSPEADPGRETRWLEPYFDRFEGLWMTSCVSPLYRGDEFEGAVGLDLLLPSVSREVLRVAEGPSTDLFLVAQGGRLVAAGPGAVERLAVNDAHRAALRRTLLPADHVPWRQEEVDALHTSLADHREPEVRALVAAMSTGRPLERTLTLGGTELYLTVEPVASTGWSLAVLEPKADALSGVDAVRSAIRTRATEARRHFGVFVLLVVVLGGGLGAFLYALTVRPITRFTRRVERLTPDALDFVAEDTRRGDEIGQLHRKFADLMSVLRRTQGELTAERDAKERQVVERTAELRDREAALRQLEEARSALEEADHHKDQFLAMLGHELRNPLFAIRNAVWLLGRADPSREQLRTLHGVLDRQTAHMTALVEGLLDVSRIARGKLVLRRAPTDVAEIARRVVQDRLTQIEGQGLSVATELDLPLWVDGDDVRLTQVISNLVGNAIKFTPAGGRLTVSARREGGKVVVRVRDTGVGIDPALQPHLFEAFRQGPQDLARSEGGLGLGLALAKGLAELHGGTLEASSPGRGQGSEFVLRLPPGRAPTGATPMPSPVVAPPRRILVVEDNEDAARLLVRILEEAGHTVGVARDGREAVERIRAERPAVVLCDLGLPELSGYDVARQVRADPALQGVKLVALTGYGQAEDVRRTREAGFDLHLTKPVDPGAIEAALVA